MLPSSTSMFTQIRHILFSYADINTLVAAFICKSGGQIVHWHMYIFTFTPLEYDGGVVRKSVWLHLVVADVVISWQRRASMTHGNSEDEGNLDLDWMFSESLWLMWHIHYTKVVLFSDGVMQRHLQCNFITFNMDEMIVLLNCKTGCCMVAEKCKTNHDSENKITNYKRKWKSKKQITIRKTQQQSRKHYNQSENTMTNSKTK